MMTEMKLLNAYINLINEAKMREMKEKIINFSKEFHQLGRHVNDFFCGKVISFFAFVVVIGIWNTYFNIE